MFMFWSREEEGKLFRDAWFYYWSMIPPKRITTRRLGWLRARLFFARKDGNEMIAENDGIDTVRHKFKQLHILRA